MEGNILRQVISIFTLTFLLLQSLFALFVGNHLTHLFSPGFLDIQINGAYNFDFSVYESDEVYRQGLGMVAERIVETGVTSYVMPSLEYCQFANLSR